MGISVALISFTRQDAGRTTVTLHSLELATSVWQALSNPSWLITDDYSRAGTMAGGGPAGARGFPFFFLGWGAMTSAKRGARRRCWIYRRGGKIGKEEIRAERDNL